MSPEARRRVYRVRLTALVALGLLAAALFMTLGAKGSWSFILPFRGAKLLSLVLIGSAIALSTVVFQTITRNRILTPSIMGFDALYILIQTVLVFTIGAHTISVADPRIVFVGEVVLMLAFAGLLHAWLFGANSRSLHFLLLVGIIFGTLFRSIAGFLQRLLDPDAFMVLQDRFFASFNGIDQHLLLLSSIIVLAAAVVLWRMAPLLDVLALGREQAIGLGVDHSRAVAIVLSIAILLVCVSTALVGPVSFLGLLVANLAYLLMPGARHSVLLPTAAILGAICLVGGQTILERVFAFDTALVVIVEFIGGILFIALVIRGRG